MSKKTLKLYKVEVNKKEFHASKQAIALNLVNVNQMLISDKYEHSGKGFEYFIGYKNDNIIRPLCIILPQMNGYIKYFENGGKNMSFTIENDSVLKKFNEIWGKLKKAWNIKFHKMPVYNEKYIKVKVKKLVYLTQTFQTMKYQKTASITLA